MEIHSFTEVNGPLMLTNKIWYDNRGWFSEVYRTSEIEKTLGVKFVQENISHSFKNVIRGLHYQTSPKEQGKLIRCINGIIHDVFVDIRKDSQTFGKWGGLIMYGGDVINNTVKEDTYRMIWIPPGFAHGFSVVSESATVAYSVTSEYSKEHEKTLKWNDDKINIIEQHILPRTMDMLGFEKSKVKFAFEVSLMVPPPVQHTDCKN